MMNMASVPNVWSKRQPRKPSAAASRRLPSHEKTWASRKNNAKGNNTLAKKHKPSQQSNNQTSEEIAWKHSVHCKVAPASHDGALYSPAVKRWRQAAPGLLRTLKQLLSHNCSVLHHKPEMKTMLDLQILS